MNNEEFNKSKNELEKIKDENEKQILINDERTRMAKVNNLEYKGGVTLFFSIFSYMLLFVLTAILIKILGLNTMINIFPGFSYPFVLIGGSLGIGTISRILFDSKFHIKDRLKQFSTAKTQAEKLEEEIHYQIELEKLNNRNKVIDDTLSILNSNQAMFNRYDLRSEVIPATKELAENKDEMLSFILKEQYDRLDVLTVQKVLAERFWKVRSKFHRRTEILVNSMVSGLFTMMFAGLPSILFNGFVASGSTLGSILTLFISLFSGITFGSLYTIKRNKDYKKVFDNLNALLGGDALKENLDQDFESTYNEEKTIEEFIERQIRDVSLTEIQLQENKRCLESYVSEFDKKNDYLFEDFPELHITEETRKDVIEHPEKYAGCDVRIRMGKFYTDEEIEQIKETEIDMTLDGEKEKKYKKKLLKK